MSHYIRPKISSVFHCFHTSQDSWSPKYLSSDETLLGDELYASDSSWRISEAFHWDIEERTMYGKFHTTSPNRISLIEKAELVFSRFFFFHYAIPFLFLWIFKLSFSSYFLTFSFSRIHIFSIFSMKLEKNKSSLFSIWRPWIFLEFFTWIWAVTIKFLSRENYGWHHNEGWRSGCI